MIQSNLALVGSRVHVWHIQIGDARNILEVCFNVLPVFALTFLVSDSKLFGISWQSASLEEPRQHNEMESERPETVSVRRAHRQKEAEVAARATVFYASFLIAIALAGVGLIAPMTTWLLAFAVTAFAATTFGLFSRIGRSLLGRLEASRPDNAQNELPNGWGSFGIGYWIAGTCTLVAELVTETKKGKRRKAVFVNSSSLLAIYALTLLYFIGIVTLDLLLVTTGEIIG